MDLANRTKAGSICLVRAMRIHLQRVLHWRVCGMDYMGPVSTPVGARAQTGRRRPHHDDLADV